MFKILIVEDDTEKLKNILQALQVVPGVDVDSIDHEVDLFGAKKRLQQTFYDLLIIDISIPLRKSEEVDPEGGIKLLVEVLQRNTCKVPAHIIGLTAHEDIFSKAEKQFKSHVVSLIKYSLSDIEWQNEIQNGVTQWMQSKNAIATTPAYNYDIAVITALRKELDAVKALSSEWERVNVPNDSTTYYESIFKTGSKTFRVIAACAPQMGMIASSVLSMKLIYNFRPRFLFMTGIAASIQKSEVHGFGDVIVFDESWDGGAGKITQDENGDNIFLPTANHLRLNTDMSEKFRNLQTNIPLLRQIKDGWRPNSTPNTELNVHIGSMASVAGVIENKAVVEELKSKDRKLLGLELEVYGMYYAAANCSSPKPIAVALKGVSDFASVSKNDEYQTYASYTSAKLMHEFILTELS